MDLPLTAFGEVQVAEPHCHAAWRFDYGINSRIIRSTTANGGTVSVDGNRAKLSTSAAVNGSARIETLKRLRYMPGIGGLLRITSVFSTPKADSYQIVGLGDGTDGLYIGFWGTDMVVGKIRGGVHTRVAKTDWNGGLDSSYNHAAGNIFQIRFQWLGYGYLRFYMLDFTDEHAGYAPLHTINYPNTSPDVHILNPTLPIFAEVANTGNNSNMILHTPSAAAFSEGDTNLHGNPLDVFNSFDTTATFANTNINHLVTIRNKSIFLAQANRVPVQINTISLSRGSGAPLTTLRLYKSATFAGALTYADVDTNNSPVDASATTTTITAGTIERAYSAASGSMLTIEFQPGEMVLQPGEALTLAVIDSGVQSTEVIATINWSEQF